MVLEEDSIVDPVAALQYSSDTVVDIRLDSRVVEEPFDEGIAIQCRGIDSSGYLNGVWNTRNRI